MRGKNGHGKREGPATWDVVQDAPEPLENQEMLPQETRWGPGPWRSSWARDRGRSSPSARAATVLCEPEGPQMAASLSLLPIMMGHHLPRLHHDGVAWTSSPPHSPLPRS